MTNDDMIKWAELEQASDFIWHAKKEDLDKLIWIAQKEARMEVWKMISETTKQNHDMEACESYPRGFFARKNDMPTDEDYLAALGPCGK
jgi:hypothetical protein